MVLLAGRKKFTVKQFIDAIPGTGGVISALADKVGCNRNTAKNYIDKYQTVSDAFEQERNTITDRAKNNVVKAIEDGDLSISKWWLTVKDPEFIPKQDLNINQPAVVVIEWDDDTPDIQD